jgi:arylsulfatase A-like enzyme
MLLGCGREAAVTNEREKPADDKPNIIFVMTDDQDAESVRHMPHLRSLMAERGTTFENAFVTNALCCPSRATLLRGQYSHNHGIVGNEWPEGGFRKFRASGAESSTIATRMKSAGYRTAYFGKYLNGYRSAHVPPGWDEWRAVAGNYLSNHLSENGRFRYYDPEKTHDTDILADKAISYVDEAAKKDPPFFAVIAPRAPHDPAIPAPRHEGEFEDTPLPRPPSFDEGDVSDKPAWIRARPRLDAARISYLEALHENRLQSLQSVDEMLPRLMQTLRENKKLDDTYIVFTSDNGYHMGHHRLAAGKWTPYEEDIRVPLIIRGPGVPEGEKVEEIALNNDLAPTFTDLAGIKPRASVDGRSLAPLLDEDPSSPENWRTAFLVEEAVELPDGRLINAGPENWRTAFLVEEAEKEAARRPELAAIRTKNSIYIEYANGEREFYDLEKDPFQLENEYEDADPELLRRQGNRLEELRNCEGENCRIAEGGEEVSR